MTVSGLMDLEYKFSATVNNGQATAMKNHVSGEEVQYTYDSLKRLIKADTVGPEWRQEYGYDGFGNLLSKSVTKGSAPAMSVSINPANNRVNGYTYDANGNATVLPATFTLGYDVENRMVSNVLGGGGSETYGYGPDGKRVWRNTAAGQNRVYFYGLNGERQWIYSWGVIDGGTGNIGFYLVALESVVPKGLQVDRDRLGSVVSGGLKYDPWGAEFTVTSNERDKFGTYYRDSTGLNYAEQRYYGSTGGRFLSADPYTASAGAGRPQSWNRYVYVEGDPANLIDPRGLEAEDPPPVVCIVNGQTYHGSFACAIVPLLNPFGGSRQGGAVEIGGAMWSDLESASQNQLVVDTFRRIREGLLSDSKCLDWLANGTSWIGYGSLATRTEGVLAHVSSAAATTLIGTVTLTSQVTDNGVLTIDAQRVSLTSSLTYNGTHVDIILNRNGAFFTGSERDRVTILLHELAHVVGARRFLSGDGIPARAESNERVLRENCNSLISSTRSQSP